MRVTVGAAGRAARVGAHGCRRPIDLGGERQHVVVQDRDRRLRLFGDAATAAGIGPAGVDEHVQIDLVDVRSGGDHGGVDRELVLGSGVFDLPLRRAGIEVLSESAPLGGQLDDVIGGPPSHREPAVAPGAATRVVEHPLPAVRRARLALRGSPYGAPITPATRVRQRAPAAPLAHLRRCRPRARPGDRQEGPEPFQARRRLETSLPLGDARPATSAMPAQPGDVPQRPRELPSRPPPVRQLSLQDARAHAPAVGRPRHRDAPRGRSGSSRIAGQRNPEHMQEPPPRAANGRRSAPGARSRNRAAAVFRLRHLQAGHLPVPASNVPKTVPPGRPRAATADPATFATELAVARSRLNRLRSIGLAPSPTQRRQTPAGEKRTCGDGKSPRVPLIA